MKRQTQKKTEKKRFKCRTVFSLLPSEQSTPRSEVETYK